MLQTFQLNKMYVPDTVNVTCIK